MNLLSPSFSWVILFKKIFTLKKRKHDRITSEEFLSNGGFETLPNGGFQFRVSQDSLPSGCKMETTLCPCASPIKTVSSDGNSNQTDKK